MTPVRRLKHVADIRFSSVDKKSVDGQIPVKLCNYTDVYYSERIHGEMPFMDASATPDQVDAFTLRAGDVLLTKDSETADDIGVSAFVPQDLPGVLCGYHLAVARPDPSLIDGRYLRWALVATPSRKQLELAATGVTRFGLRQDAVEGVTLSVPPLMKQHAIADFLDAETARIDGTLARRLDVRQLVEEREETALRLLIIGSDGSNRPISSLATYLNGFPFKPDDFTPTGMPVIRIRQLVDAEADQDMFDGWVPERVRLRDGDLVFSWSASLEVRIWDRGPAILNQHLFRVLPAAGIERDWLRWVLHVTRADFAGFMHGSTMTHITQPMMREVRVPVPDVEIQRRISLEANALHERTASLVMALDRQVALLTEHRQALIAAAVTGQLDIPGAAA